MSRAAISATTALCGIFLHPAGHTRSPAMHNAAYAALGLDAVYLAFDVAPGDLGAAIAGARALHVRQLAISIPPKQAVIPYLDRIDDTARAIGAVNTVTRVGAEIKRPIEAANEPLTQAVNFSSSGCAWEACPSVPGAGGGLEKK